jgi:uncharacterized membrane protein YbaN (DUF454 family)
MNAQEAREILLLYRPGTDDANDPAVAEALAMARRDPELARWFENHCAFQEQMRARLRGIEVPPDLKAALLAEAKIIRPQPWWQQPAWIAAAAAVVVLLGLAGFYLRAPSSDRLANFQSRMISTATREYQMDLVTNDMRQLRQFIAARGAPADYDLTQGLEKLSLTGGGLLRWRNHPVAMVCFDRGDKQMLFLFVLKRAAIQDPPPETPRLSKVDDLLAVTWSRGENVYLLAGPDEADFLRKYL